MSKPNPFLTDGFPEFEGIPSESRILQDSTTELQTARRNVLAIGDLDANAAALTGTLQAANLITISRDNQTNQIVPVAAEIASNYTIIQTGDIFDRGNSLLLTLDHIKSLQEQGVDFRYIAGNHEIDALYNFSSQSFKNDNNEYYENIGDLAKFIAGLEHPTAKLTKLEFLRQQMEKRGKYGQPQADAVRLLNWFFGGGKEIFQELQKKYLDPQTTDLRSMLETGAEIFFGNGEYADLMRSMSAMEQVDNCLYLHGGIDDIWAELIEEKGSIEAVNEVFREQIAQKNLDPLSCGKYKGLFWARTTEGPILTPKAVAVLKKLNIQAVIRGHDTQSLGMQTVENIDGIIVVNGDIGAGRPMNPGGVIVNAAGDIIGFNFGDYDNKTVLARLPSVESIQEETADKIGNIA